MGFYTVDKYGFPVPGGNVSGNLPPGPWSQEVIGNPVRGGGPGAAGQEFPQDALRALYAPPSSAGGMEASQAKMRGAFEGGMMPPGMAQPPGLSPQEEEKMRRMFEMRQMMMEQMRMRAERDWSGMAGPGPMPQQMPQRDLPMPDFYGPKSRMQPQQVEEVMQQQSLPRGGY